MVNLMGNGQEERKDINIGMGWQKLNYNLEKEINKSSEEIVVKGIALENTEWSKI